MTLNYDYPHNCQRPKLLSIISGRKRATSLVVLKERWGSFKHNNVTSKCQIISLCIPKEWPENHSFHNVISNLNDRIGHLNRSSKMTYVNILSTIWRNSITYVKTKWMTIILFLVDEATLCHISPPSLIVFTPCPCVSLIDLICFHPPLINVPLLVYLVCVFPFLCTGLSLFSASSGPAFFKWYPRFLVPVCWTRAVFQYPYFLEYTQP